MGELSVDTAMSLMSEMLWIAVKLSAPLIALTTAASLVVSILQVVTQVQESSLAFVPKLIVAVAVLLVLGGWMLTALTSYATNLFESIPNLV